MGIPRVTRALGALALALVGSLVATTARAEPRPTEGGLWSFDPADVIDSWEEPTGTVRVHYSTDGPNVTLLADSDGDLVPDYPQLIALTTTDALAFYTARLGTRLPVPETEVGDELGGSAALDIYLIDFGGAADGRFGTDGCTADPGHCSGFLVIENDFFGYAYPSLEQAAATVASHELFHAIQAAYAELPVWMSEGTATWATRRYDPTLLDFIYACGGYLADPGRPIYEPPPGPVPGFAYGSALWWEFVTARNGDPWVHALLIALDDDDGSSPPEQIMHQAVTDAGDLFEDAWVTFARYNLAAGFRSGAAPSHPYAGQLDAIEADTEGSELDINARVFPLATEYWRLDHPGGALSFGADEPMDGVVFSLHPVAKFAPDGAVGEPISEWDAEQAGSRLVYEPELPAGGYWIVATRPIIADGSAQARVCIGSAEHVEGCGIEPVPEDEGSSESGTLDDGGSGSTEDTGADSGSDSGSETTAAADDGTDTGCGCRSRPRPGHAPWAVLPWALMLARRRPRSS